ncbi:hypothetical protein VTN77DRAFT_4303 [Rasamsonia byssochlamydoides]|uniref:uncharacterized protein n=1 Tax=Rasamsonia byssochlamydoides TaxID=89139 RepID=UPI00374339AA
MEGAGLRFVSLLFRNCRAKMAMKLDRKPNPFLLPAKSSKYVEFCEGKSSASLAHHKIGSVRVDCCFLLSKTRWDRLDEKNAGLIYLDLTFHQPEGCKLASATITLSFFPFTPQGDVDPGLEITEYFGPQMLSGEMKEDSVSRKFVFQPQVGAMGFSTGGIGLESGKESTTASRWVFEGKRLPADEEVTTVKSSRYRRLIWHFEENRLEQQPVHNHTFHTGLVFEHEAKPFLLELELSQGKSESLKDIAQSLNETLISRNCHPVPEIPNPRPVADEKPQTSKDGVANILDVKRETPQLLISNGADDLPPLYGTSNDNPGGTTDGAISNPSLDSALLSSAQRILTSKGAPLKMEPSSLGCLRQPENDDDATIHYKLNAGERGTAVIPATQPLPLFNLDNIKTATLVTICSVPHFLATALGILIVGLNHLHVILAGVGTRNPSHDNSR